MDNRLFAYYTARELRRSSCSCYQDRNGEKWCWCSNNGRGYWQSETGGRRNNSQMAAVKLRPVWDVGGEPICTTPEATP